MTNVAVANMADAIAAVVERRDWVTFAELDRLVAGFKAEPGDNVAVCLGPQVVWSTSNAGHEALCMVWDSGRVCAAASSRLVYMIDGKMIREEKWLPLTLRPGRFTNYHTPSPGNLAFFVEPKSLKSLTRKRTAKQSRR